LSRVDFYILPDVDASASRRFACRLAYKALERGMRVHVHVDDSAAADDVDTLMWEYPPEQFLPHARADAPESSAASVTIDCGEAAIEPVLDGLLINLSRKVPPWAGRFARIAEIVTAPERELGRVRYRHYRGEGHHLEHHTLDDWEA
jgi:DNA polymerase-3 subunit chi